MRKSMKTVHGVVWMFTAMLLVAPLAVAQQQSPVTKVTWNTADNPGVILVQNVRIWT